MSPNVAALQRHLEACLERPFVFAEHDCLTFSNAAWAAAWGSGWADDWIGRYHDRRGLPLARSVMRRRFKHDTLEAAIDARLARAGRYPPRGALVASRSVGGVGAPFELALGICNGTISAFVGATGLIYIETQAVACAWVPRCPS